MNQGRRKEEIISSLQNIFETLGWQCSVSYCNCSVQHLCSEGKVSLTTQWNYRSGDLQTWAIPWNLKNVCKVKYSCFPQWKCYSFGDTIKMYLVQSPGQKKKKPRKHLTNYPGSRYSVLQFMDGAFTSDLRGCFFFLKYWIFSPPHGLLKKGLVHL